MEERMKNEEQAEKRAAVLNTNTDNSHGNHQDPTHFVGDILALTLIASMMTLQNIDGERAIHLERNRIVKERASLGVLLNQLMLDLEEEINTKLFEQTREAENKVEEIKVEIEQCEMKIFSLGEYANKLGRSLKLFKKRPSLSGPQGISRKKKSEEVKVSHPVRIAAKPVKSTPSPTTSASSSSSTYSVSNISDRRNRIREWRKIAGMKQDVSTWKIITPAIVKSRQELDLLTSQLNAEICRQMNSGRTPTRAVLRKIKNLEQGIEECEEEIKAEEERAVNIYKSAIVSKDTRIRLRMSTKASHM